MRNRIYVISILTLVVCLIGSVALAGGLKDRMRARVPAINSLKAQGVVGESNVGLLEYISVKQEIEVVRSENADRLIVYKAIAQKTGTTVNVVGQRRAAKIAQKAPAGTWLQGADGKWYQK
ncbi:YdbL family protein [uncultured Pseudodesulfovibrio sp.]|uniref:YdbL family protein n=1 Tax=uncultured Pseudodesulfovibrio sp. TaxID=2035858 RepID=UPI0029C651BD|nr:YdbL family protein [uncultured Pseudodesulfovibrio sp.]